MFNVSSSFSWLRWRVAKGHREGLKPLKFREKSRRSGFITTNIVMAIFSNNIAFTRLFLISRTSNWRCFRVVFELRPCWLRSMKVLRLQNFTQWNDVPSSAAEKTLWSDRNRVHLVHVSDCFVNAEYFCFVLFYQTILGDCLEMREKSKCIVAK